MQIIVNPHNIYIKKSELVNEKEINITTCEFEFSEEYTDDLVKEAIFTKDNKSYKIIINNNQCQIPYEVLDEKGEIELGVIAYEIENEEYVKRFNPTPVYLTSLFGSMKDEYENEEPITPSDKEQIEAAINNKQDRLISGINIKTINNQSILGEGNIDIQGGGSSYVEGNNIYFTEDITTGATAINAINTIYNDTQVKADISNLQENKADKTEIPDVSNFVTKSVNDLTNYYLKSETYTQSEINALIGAISTMDIEVVQVLPTEDISTTTIYLVPKTTALVNNIYDEYIYVSNTWEKIGDTQIDLSNYIQKSLTNGLIKNDGTIDTNTYLTQHQDISGKEDISNKVTSISSSSTDAQYPSAKCVYDIIGNINTILSTLTTPSNNGGN